MVWSRVENEEASSAVAVCIRLVGLALAVAVSLAMWPMAATLWQFILVPAGILALFVSLAAVAGRCELLLLRQKQNRQLLLAVRKKLGLDDDADKA